MKRFKARRTRNLAVLAVFCLLLIALEWYSGASIRATTYWSGWGVLGLVFFLALYNIRKKFPFLPLGSSASWFQLHIYVGLFCILLFSFHLRWRIPNGNFEIVLGISFALVALSGVLGLLVSRSFARRMTTRGPEEIYERIPRAQHHIRVESERLVLKCMEETQSTAIPEFYQEHLLRFFARPRNMFWHLVLSRRPRQQIYLLIEAQRRFLTQSEGVVMDELENHVNVKDNLDFQFAHQTVLKYWLFLHIPGSYALLVFACFHAILVHAASGDLP